MSVRLRLKRMGRTHKPFFRLAAMEGRRPRDGRVLEELGHYDPANKNPEMQLHVDDERVKYWLDLGAVPTETVSTLLKRRGLKVR